MSDYGNELFLRLKDGADPRRVLAAAAGRVAVQKFEIAEPSIHDIFIEQVSGGGDEMKALHIIRREYVESAKKRSFIISTILAPDPARLDLRDPHRSRCILVPPEQVSVAVLDRTGLLAPGVRVEPLRHARERRSAV